MIVDAKMSSLIMEQAMGSEIATCDGCCGSEFSKWLTVIIAEYNGHQRTSIKDYHKWTLARRMRMIEKDFWSAGDRLRKCLVQLMEKCTDVVRLKEGNDIFLYSFQEEQKKNNKNQNQDQENQESKYIAFYKLLKDDKIFINFDYHNIQHDKEWVERFEGIFKLFLMENKCHILKKMAEEACIKKPMTLLEEVKHNLKNEIKIDRHQWQRKIEELKMKEEYQLMMDAGLPLTNNELLALYLYTNYDIISSEFRKSLRKAMSCEWKHLYGHISRGIRKMHKVFVEGNKLTTFLPKILFHGMSVKCEASQLPWKFLTITSCTTDVNVAKRFTNGGTLLQIPNCAQALSDGKLIAATVKWLSAYPEEEEWILLPIQFTAAEPIEMGDHALFHVWKITEFQCKDWISVNDVDQGIVPLMNVLGKSEQTEHIFNQLRLLKMTVAFAYHHRCPRCDVVSSGAEYEGGILDGTLRCPCCRRRILGSVNNDNELIRCYACQVHAPLKQFVFPSQKDRLKFTKADDANGVICPNCFIPQKLAMHEYFGSLRYGKYLSKNVPKAFKTFGEYIAALCCSKTYDAEDKSCTWNQVIDILGDAVADPIRYCVQKSTNRSTEEQLQNTKNQMFGTLSKCGYRLGQVIGNE